VVVWCVVVVVVWWWWASRETSAAHGQLMWHFCEQHSRLIADTDCVATVRAF
jgi:hypothetical protein